MFKNLLMTSALFLVSFSACNNGKGNEAANLESVGSITQECRLDSESTQTNAKKSFSLVLSSTQKNWIATNRLFELPFGEGTATNPKYLVKFADFEEMAWNVPGALQEIKSKDFYVGVNAWFSVTADGKTGIDMIYGVEYPMVNGVKAQNPSRIWSYSCDIDGKSQRVGNNTKIVPTGTQDSTQVSGTSSFGNTVAINAAGPSISVSSGSNPAFSGKEIRINLDQCTTMLVTKADNSSETKVEFNTDKQCSGGKNPQVLTTSANSIIMRLQ